MSWDGLGFVWEEQSKQESITNYLLSDGAVSRPIMRE